MRVIKKKKKHHIKAHARKSNQHTRDRYSSQFENNYFTEMCSGSKAGSYLRLIEFVYDSNLGFRVIKEKRREGAARRAVCGLGFRG